MRAHRLFVVAWIVTAIVAAIAPVAHAVRKPHVVVLGGARRVPYSKTGDPSGAMAGEESLKIRALTIDGIVKEWTTGDPHDVTDRSYAVRRAIRLNDALPGEKQAHWVWQRGPWILIDRTTGHVTALHLPDYAPGVSQVSWFRDYAAYCGLAANGKSLYAVVAQVAARKPALAKKLSAFDAAHATIPVCTPPEWQRVPLSVTFHPTGQDVARYEFVPGSAVLIEDADEEETSDASGAK